MKARIRLSSVPISDSKYKGSKVKLASWKLIEYIFVYNPLQWSSKIRILALKAYGAKIGAGAIYRPRTRVSFPWNLRIGNNCWIGEGVWIHNQTNVVLGDDVVISQDSFLTTGSHAHLTDMRLTLKPIEIHNGVWLTSRCVVLGGSVIMANALVTPNSVVRNTIPADEIWGSSESAFIMKRTYESDTNSST
jgi:putative colanic acid biosynthesis acetyltransferase WcaF